MVTTQQQHSPFAIGMIAFVIGVIISLGYYQFFYLPEINKKPVIPQEVLNPLKVAEVKMIAGASNPQQADNFIPKLVEVELAVNNKVRWTNEDQIGHTVTSDTLAEDKYSGQFNSLKTIGSVQPGKSYEFLFTQPGEFPYHCEPHPWMKGMIKVLRQKF